MIMICHAFETCFSRRAGTDMNQGPVLLTLFNEKEFKFFFNIIWGDVGSEQCLVFFGFDRLITRLVDND